MCVCVLTCRSGGTNTVMEGQVKVEIRGFLEGCTQIQSGIGYGVYLNEISLGYV